MCFAFYMYVFFVKCVILYFRLTYFCKVSTALSRTGLAFAVSPSTGLNIILTVTMAITMMMIMMTMMMTKMMIMMMMTSPSTGLDIILTVTMAMITMIMTPMTMTMIDDDDITMAISRIPTLFWNYLIPGEQAETLLAR